MTKAAFSSISSKSKGQVVFENVLLALCFCVIALRTMLTESPGTQSSSMPGGPDDTVYSLSLSAVLICLSVVWFISSFCRGSFIYRRTGIEIGLGLFIIAALISIIAAANKRAAITHFVIVLSPVLMAVLLVQLLDSHTKIKLLLAVIAALGVVQAYQSAEQFFLSNQMTIEQYEENRQAVLEPLGIEPGTFAQFLFEHRLYTKGVRGFFTTSNSAASFAILASFAAVGLFVDKLKNRKNDASGSLQVVVCGIGAALVIFGFFITRSKGAFIAMFAAIILFTSYLLFGDWVKRHKKAIFVVFLLLFVAGCCAIISYGISHGRLPGGNSMLVRWQYWSGAAKMYVDNPLTGVGGGNFGSFYTHYKEPSALETVSDPHNFVLSILTQYGPLGLIGFLSVFSIPLWRTSSSQPEIPSPKDKKHLPAYTKLTIPFLIVISAVLLLIRPAVSTMPAVGSFEEKYAAIILLYVIPLVVFIAGFLLLTTARISNKADYVNIAAAALFCACIGILIHNLIDFALFEPGVFTTFCAVIASMIALDYHQKSRQEVIYKPSAFIKVSAAAGGLVILWAYFYYALIPVANAAANIKPAMQGIGYTHEYLDRAAGYDKLDTTALNLNGRLYIQDYAASFKKQPVLLEKAAQCFLEAIRRDNADFKNYEKLSQVYNLLGDNKAAYRRALEAAERYPGSDRLQFNLGQIAEKLNEIQQAVEHYKKAVSIEDQFRAQFRQMYPGREIVSRLGEEKYQFALKKVKELSY